MEEAKGDPSPRTYDAIMGEMNAKFNTLIDLSRKDSAPLDLTRSGVLLPDFENFLSYLAQTRREVEAMGLPDKLEAELLGVLESRQATAENYRKILQDVEDRKKGRAQHE